MSADCQSINPITRDGTSQKSRTPEMLDPSMAPLDDRSLLDLLSFIRSFSKQINFFDIQNEIKGDWEDFFSSDELFIPVSIHDFDVSDLRKAVIRLDQWIDQESSVTKLKSYFQTYFDLLFSLAYQVNDWSYRSAEGLSMSLELQRTIASELRADFAKLIGYYLEAGNSKKLISNPITEFSASFKLLPTNTVLVSDFQKSWIQGEYESWADYYTSIEADDGVYGEERGNVSLSIKTATYTLHRMAEKYISVLLQLQSKCEGFLNDAIDGFSAHQPHNALMITFLRLFKYNQDYLNEITQRHLDFYYQEVLKFDLKEQIPSKVHLFFELIKSKHISSYLLEQNTAFKAGKDQEGNPVIFTSKSDLIVNKSSISDLRSLYLDRNNGDFPYSAPVSNSKNGQGEEFTEEHTPWKAFGQTQLELGTDETTMLEAQIGWAMSSKVLLMSEGERRITISLTLNQEIDPESMSEWLDISITGENGWFSCDINLLESQTDRQNNVIHLVINLSSSDDAVISFDSELHGEGISGEAPMIRFIAKKMGTGVHAYEQLKRLTMTDARIEVSASLSALILQNDASNLNSSGPFMPFGAQPSKGSSFIIGSEEAFSKKVVELTLSGAWLELPEGGLSENYAAYVAGGDQVKFTCEASKLENGGWNKISSSQDLFKSDQMDIFLNLEEDMYDADFSEGKYKKGVKSGYIKLQLSEPGFGFGHKIYPQLYARATVTEMNKTLDSTNTGTFNPDNLPHQPYTPLLTDFILSYTARDEIQMNEMADQSGSSFIHIHPFGFEQMILDETGTSPLMPQFGHLNENEKWIAHEGCFYIGLENLNPPESLTLYLEVSEGSENPEKDTQEVIWFYLIDNDWVPFGSTQIISDSTNGLLQSGIIKFELPKEFNDAHTVMPHNKYWIKAVVEENTDAVCDIIRVETQAVEAEFQDTDNHFDFLATALPAGTISKSVNRVSSVKSINQPFASYEGKKKESRSHFYTRVSERLRHKSRGINIWDYERLVLEQYSEIYKVKTINHSTYQRVAKNETTFDSEFAPGFVTVIVLPDVTQMNLADLYKPRVSKAKLISIQSFLQSKMPASAAGYIQVQNPKFEQIQVDFEVEFNQEDRGYYERQLNTDLKKYLSPWAFEEGREINFGGRIHKSTLLNFVEERPYVDYVKYFKMNHFIDDENIRRDIEEAVPSSSKTVFVTVANEDIKSEHLIKEITL